MASEVDSLSIKISAKSQEANAQVDKLISKLSYLSKTLGSVDIKVSSITKSLSSVDTKGLQKFSSGISILGDSISTFGGDGGDDEEENSFSDGRYHQRHQGEAASSCYGFLCIWYHLI